MTTTRLRLVSILLAGFLLMAGGADAGIIEWIDQMSGPGPFLGFSIEGRLHCFPIQRSDDVYTEGTPKSPPSEKSALDNYNQRMGVILACPNHLKPGERAWMTVNLASGIAWALHNDLPYSRDVTDTSVKLVSLEPSFWWYPLPPVAVGASVGFYWFSGPAFETFSRFYVKPVQVELKPFAFPKHRWHTHAEIFTIRAGYSLMPQGVQASDFGAIGPFKTEHEVLPTIALLADLGSVKGLKWFH
jgi:hypothetical protein